MADNVAVTEGSGKTIRTDDVGGFQYQVIKLAFGADGAATLVDAAGNEFPVQIINLEQAEDAAHQDGDSGVMLLAVRKDSAAALAGTDGDYIPLIVDAMGRLYTVVEGTVTVDATGQGDVPVTLDSEAVVLGAPGDGTYIGDIKFGESLPAGTNAIGKLAANSGVDIGDVDVTSLPAAVQGPGNPVINSYSSAVVDLAASTANQTLVAAQGVNTQIWVYGLFMMADTAAGTVTLQDEDDTALSGTMAVSDEGGWVLPMSGNFAMPWIKVATNKALEADTGACTVDGILTYAVVDVS